VRVRDLGIAVGTLLDMRFQDLAICFFKVVSCIGYDLLEA
jgi:hypothetical protein